MRYPPIPTQRYLHACKYRVPVDETNEKSALCCTQLSDVAGHSVGTTPLGCARCMLNGAPDETYLQRQKKSLARNALFHVTLGFYENPDDIADVVKRAVSVLGATDGKVKAALVRAVRSGRMTEAQAVEAGAAAGVK